VVSQFSCGQTDRQTDGQTDETKNNIWYSQRTVGGAQINKNNIIKSYITSSTDCSHNANLLHELIMVRDGLLVLPRWFIYFILIYKSFIRHKLVAHKNTHKNKLK